MNGGTLLEQIIYVDWAFSNGPSNWASRRKNMRSVSMPYFCKLKIIGDDILLEREDVSEIKCLSPEMINVSLNFKKITISGIF